jgi:hypothetical protein
LLILANSLTAFFSFSYRHRQLKHTPSLALSLGLVLGSRFGSVPSFGLSLCLVLGLVPCFGLVLCSWLGSWFKVWLCSKLWLGFKQVEE